MKTSSSAQSLRYSRRSFGGGRGDILEEEEEAKLGRRGEVSKEEIEKVEDKLGRRKRRSFVGGRGELWKGKRRRTESEY